MDDGHVALNTGEDVKEHLYARDDGKHVAAHPQHHRVIEEGTAAADDGPGDTEQLHGDHVVGEDICGIHRAAAAVLAPALEASVEDIDGEGQEEQDVGDGEGCEDAGAGRCVEAAVEEERWGRVCGRLMRTGKGDV